MIIKFSKITEYVLLISVITLVFFYDLLSSSIGFFDEFLGLLSFFVLLYYIAFKGRLVLFRKEYYVLILLSFIIFLGIASNISAYYKGYKTDLLAVFSDLINFTKAFAAYFALRLFSKHYNSKKVLNKISKYVEIIFYILLVLVLLDIIFTIFPKSKRYGFNSLMLFFKHASRYAFAFSFIFLALLPKHYQKNKGLLFLILIIGTFSLRVKYFGFVGLTLIIMFYGKRLFKIPKLYFLSFICILSLFLIWLFRYQIEMYFVFDTIEDAWSRAVILYYSYIIGNDYFPLGTGFGTYSSYYSGYYYSWVYDLYGIDNVYGISRRYWNFVADQYWPMVLGQFGYLGLFSMIMIIYNFFTLFLNKIKANRDNEKYYYLLSAILGLFLLLIDSTSDAIFTQQRAVVMFIFFALVVNTIDKKHESITNK